MQKIEVISEIQKFLEGHNDTQFLVNLEAHNNSNKAFCIFNEPNGKKYHKSIEYTPFLYMKNLKKNGLQLYDGDRELQTMKANEFGISIIKMETGGQPRLEDGFCYKVTTTKTFADIRAFFTEGGVDMYEKEVDADGMEIKDANDRPILKYRHLFYYVKPVEQFMISTGIRLFKGIDEYSDIHRLTFDIETTGLNYTRSRMFAIGIKDNYGFNRVLEVKDDSPEEEIRLIEDFFNTIDEVKPAVISGFNSENFDFDFILGRAKLLSMDLETIKTTYSDNYQIKRMGNRSFKYGNSSDPYTATEMWGYSVIDIWHAAKRTQAVNSDIEYARLKYLCKFEGIAKENRTYIEDGDQIGKMWKDNKTFIINNTNDYIKIPDAFEEVGRKLYQLQYYKIQKKVDDVKYAEVKKKLLMEGGANFIEFLKQAKEKIGNYRFTSGKVIVRQYLLDDLWETEKVDDKYNQSSFLLAKIIPTNYARVTTMGNAAVWNLLMTTWSYEQDLAIPDYDKEKTSFTGGLTRCFKTGYTERLVKIDYASLYPMIQLSHDVFPMFDISGVMKKMLLYLTTTRNIYKKLAGATTLNNEETELLKSVDIHTYEKIVSDYEFTDAEQSKFKTQQLPLKILNNSMFGALGSGVAFNWSDNISAQRITCSGRLYLRQAIKFFNDYGCEPLLAVTDGVNFAVPKTTNIKVTNEGVSEGINEGVIEEMWQYNGETGISALIEKFNNEELKPDYMSVDNDGFFISCINLARINYALKFEKKDKKTGEVKIKYKYTGNTIKSKTIPEYIDDFIHQAFDYLLAGEGKKFVEYYYEYIDKIYYNQIPLKKIANKKKYKNSIYEYLNRGYTTSGNRKSKQAHMELMIMERTEIARNFYREKYNEEPNEEMDYLALETAVKEYMPAEPFDEYIYYVNIGTAKSHGDTQLITDKKTGNKIFSTNKISNEDLEKNPEMTGKYNSAKYIAAFNERVKSALLHSFKPEVREKIIIKDPKDRPHFESHEYEMKSFIKDEIDESLHLEDSEIEFWNRTGFDPNKVWDGFKVSERHELLLPTYDFKATSLGDILSKKHGKEIKIKKIDDKLELNDYVLIKKNDQYTLGQYNGVYVKILGIIPKLPESPQEYRLRMKPLQEAQDLSNRLAPASI
jgi:DNA polymerase elongation subunit (family B)